MTKAEKINWLNTATNEQVLEQMKWAVIMMTKGDHISTRIEGQEDYNLIMAELKKRMA